MKKSKTSRGFGLIEFRDRNNIECSVQKSSIATENCIWLGCDDADPRYFDPYSDCTWKKLEVPNDTVFNTRMHLNQKQVKKLLPILQKFIETGQI